MSKLFETAVDRSEEEEHAMKNVAATGDYSSIEYLCSLLIPNSAGADTVCSPEMCCGF